MTAIQRFGHTGTGTFGLIDNLTMNYKGNQLIKAEDAVSTSNFSNQGDFINEVSKTVEYEYDKNGNLTKDFNKGIDTISYNSLNLPISLSIKNSLGSAMNNYTYSANGKKLKVEMRYGNQPKTTDYAGNMIYENGALKLILVDGGYVENGQYHFYIQDHLGNNRAVAKADGTVIQTNHYYPYGMTFTEDNTGDPKAQSYKYGGKEFDGECGLNLYDYLARSMDPAEGRFTSVDPLAEKYYSVSPYTYCKGNPVRLIDPNGKEVVEMDKNARRNIKNTLTRSEAKYVKFNKKGILNANKINKCKSNSENMKALKAEANSNVKYKYAVADKDHNGIKFSEESGKMYRGVTEMPGAENNASPDNDVWILTSSLASENLQARNTAHEGFGHAYIYEQTNNVLKSSHTFENKAMIEWDSELKMNTFIMVKVPTNIPLEKQIKTVEKEALQNYEDTH